MACSNLQQIRDELVGLLDQQLSILEDEVFGVVTESELSEYESKKHRIEMLYAQLFKN